MRQSNINGNNIYNILFKNEGNIKIVEDLTDRTDQFNITEKIVWREMIAVPNLQVQYARQFFLGVGQRKDRYLFRDNYNALALAIHHTKHESPIEIPFAV